MVIVVSIDNDALSVAKTYSRIKLYQEGVTEAYLVDIGVLDSELERLNGESVIIYSWDVEDSDAVSSEFFDGSGSSMETVITDTENDPDFFPDEKLHLVNDSEISPVDGGYIGSTGGANLRHVSEGQRRRYREEYRHWYQADQRAVELFEELF